MDWRGILIVVVIGLVAGWLASLVVGGGGLVRYIVTGLIGAIVGSFLFGALGINLGITNPIMAQIVTATIGAIVVVLIARAVA